MNKKMTVVWSICLGVISFITVIIAISRIRDVGLPDDVIRVMGIIDMIALPVLAFTSVKRLKK